MEEKLVDITMKRLMEKFGAGNHKPGSGSASAFQGMLSGQMLRTVIDLTNSLDEKRKKRYAEHISELLDIKQQIDTRIYDRLEYLFQLDSDEFDKVIKLREERDAEWEPLKKKLLSIEEEKALTLATKIPVEIAELSLELGNFSVKVFDFGFKSARGDSGVALNSAISAIGSCLHIIELNLIKLPINNETNDIRRRKNNVRTEYNRLFFEVNRTLTVLTKEAEENWVFNESFAYLKNEKLTKSIKDNSGIEELVTKLQNSIWLQRDKIWKGKNIEDPLEILKPGVILEKILGYTYLTSESLGFYEHNQIAFEVAGLINKKEKFVKVSKKFPRAIQNFTAAHELGHALMHRQMILHRDRPIDGSKGRSKKIEEVQADKFATFFLMPSKLVKNVFLNLFGMPKFEINDDTAFGLNARNKIVLRNDCENLRGLSRLIASTKYYAGSTFIPLAQIFNVSVETMAIRLEELGIVEF